jgi:hypothetical protein
MYQSKRLIPFGILLAQISSEGDPPRIRRWNVSLQGFNQQNNQQKQEMPSQWVLRVLNEHLSRNPVLT